MTTTTMHQSRVFIPRCKIPDTPNQKKRALPALHSKIKGATAEAKGAAAEVEVVAEAEATKRKESGTTFFTRTMMTIVQTIVPKRKGLRPSYRKGKREREKQLSQPFRSDLAKSKVWKERFRQSFPTT
jgi:hypothetical protein